MSDEIRVYPVEDGFVVADDAGWVPGVFESEEAARKSAEIADLISIRREVEVEAGREHVFWTVFYSGNGYNKTFRKKDDATAHAEEILRKFGGVTCER